MVAVAAQILRIAPLGGESEQRFFAFFTLRFRKHKCGWPAHIWPSGVATRPLASLERPLPS